MLSAACLGGVLGIYVYPQVLASMLPETAPARGLEGLLPVILAAGASGVFALVVRRKLS